MVTKPPSVSASFDWQIMLVTFSPSASCSRVTMLLPLLGRLPPAGYIKRQLKATYQAQRRGGRGISGMTRKEEDDQILDIHLAGHGLDLGAALVAEALLHFQQLFLNDGKHTVRL